jgi:hypothetical protein
VELLELLEVYEILLLYTFFPQTTKVSHAVWSPVHLALEDSIISRSGLFSFFHDYMRQAVETRYLLNGRGYR